MHRYWVIGGDYADTEFRSLNTTSPVVEGPFDSEAEATAVWRELSSSKASSALTRFSVLSEKFRPAS